MNIEEQAKAFAEQYAKLKQDPDKSKILVIHALLGYDDGREYAEQDYIAAITWFDTVGAKYESFVSKAKRQLLSRYALKKSYSGRSQT